MLTSMYGYTHTHTHTRMYIYLCVSEGGGFFSSAEWFQSAAVIFFNKQFSKALGLRFLGVQSLKAVSCQGHSHFIYVCVCKCMFVCRLIICPLFGEPRPLPLLPLASSLMYKLQFSITLIFLLFLCRCKFSFFLSPPVQVFFQDPKFSSN